MLLKFFLLSTHGSHATNDLTSTKRKTAIANWHWDSDLLLWLAKQISLIKCISVGYIVMQNSDSMLMYRTCTVLNSLVFQLLLHHTHEVVVADVFSCHLGKKNDNSQIYSIHNIVHSHSQYSYTLYLPYISIVSILYFTCIPWLWSLHIPSLKPISESISVRFMILC